MGANDISRWCTVWSLIERGTYVIDECPWQIDTQDKVFRQPKTAAGPAGGPEPVGHFYSSKPALLPTLIAALLYPARVILNVPLDRVVLQQRLPRYTQQPDPGSQSRIKEVLETPKEPARWPAYVFYFKTVIILLNVLPFGVFLVCFARALDRFSADDWTWFFCLVAAAFGTYLLPFTQTLNNHTVAAFSAFFAIYAFLRACDTPEHPGWPLAATGFFAAFTATNELPALAFLALLSCLVLVRYPREALFYYLPMAVLPLAAFAAAQYAAMGEFKLQYESFGTDEYLYEGSLWKSPLDLDALNERPEPKLIYFFHMTLGHHGVFSLTPIFLFSALGAVRLLAERNPARSSMRAVALLTAVLTAVLLAFYTWNPKARNYGGSTQGLRGFSG